MTTKRARLSGALAAAALVLAAAPPPPAAAQSPEVFAPGVVTVEGESVYRGTFHPDGRSFWFFRKLPEGREEYRIEVTRRAGGGWSPPERVDLGGDHSDLYPTISPDGRLLVFTSYRPPPGGGPPYANLWYAELRPDGSLGDPVFMAEQSRPTAYDAGPRFRPDGSLTWTSETWGPAGSRRHLRARWTGDGFTAPEPDPSIEPWRSWRDDLFVWETVESPDGEWLVVEASPVAADGSRGPSDLWLARREGDGWSEPRRPGPEVNTPDAYENFAGFTPDSGALLFVRGFRSYYRLSLAHGALHP